MKTKRIRCCNVSISDRKNFFKCDLCGIRFDRKGNLVRHKNNVHFKVRKLACLQCEKRFGDKHNLQKHIASVHDKINYPCDICEKEFSIKENLTRHKKNVHEKNFSFICKLCGKGTSHKQSFDKHIKARHPEELVMEEAEYVSANPAECHKCKKRFPDSVQLQRHVNHVHRMESGIQ